MAVEREINANPYAFPSELFKVEKVALFSIGSYSIYRRSKRVRLEFRRQGKREVELILDPDGLEQMLERPLCFF